MRRFLALAALGVACGAVHGEELAPAARSELGVRYWLSTGETKLSHNGQNLNPTVGNPTSVLIYENLDANVFELFARHTSRENGFLKATLGVGQINRGMFEDEDFRRGQVKFSDTTSSVAEGRIAYGTLDIGYQWKLRGGAVSLGVFGGLTQWTEEVDAYGATDHIGFIGGGISRDTLVITNEVQWQALRIGFAGEFVFGSRLRLSLDLAVSPYARMRNEDSHHLRAQPVGSSDFALGPVPNIVDKGDGWGLQWDAELRYEILPRTELGLGLRYWYFEVREGTTSFANVPGAVSPLVEFYSTRFGVTASLRHVW